jgi:hypothetical protein
VDREIRAARRLYRLTKIDVQVAEMRGLSAEFVSRRKKRGAHSVDNGLVYPLSIGVDPDHIHVDAVPAAPHLDPVEFGSVD